MTIIRTSTMALGALCILEMNQPTQATLTESVSPNFHLIRGGGHGGGRGFENHGAENRGNEGRAAENHGEESHNNENAATNPGAGTADHPAASEDRVHTLDNRENNLRNDEAGWGDDGGWVGTNGQCSNDAIPDAFGYCTPSPQ